MIYWFSKNSNTPSEAITKILSSWVKVNSIIIDIITFYFWLVTHSYGGSHQVPETSGHRQAWYVVVFQPNSQRTDLLTEFIFVCLDSAFALSDTLSLWRETGFVVSRKRDCCPLVVFVFAQDGSTVADVAAKQAILQEVAHNYCGSWKAHVDMGFLNHFFIGIFKGFV